jgi:hypothetical protein
MVESQVSVVIGGPEQDYEAGDSELGGDDEDDWL